MALLMLFHVFLYISGCFHFHQRLHFGKLRQNSIKIDLMEFSIFKNPESKMADFFQILL
jgi:hypothetical protein